MKINNKKIAILFLLISIVLLTSCVVSAADTSNGTSSDTQKNVNTPETTTTHSDDSTQSTNTQEQTTSDTTNQVSSDTQTSSQSTSQSSSSSNTQITTKESSSNTQNTNTQSSTQSVITDNSVSTQTVNNDKQLSQEEESNSNNQTTTESIENSQNDTQINSVDSSQLSDSNKDLKTASSNPATYTDLYDEIQQIKKSSGTGSYTINLNAGQNYYITDQIYWTNSSITTLIINGNGAYISGEYKSAFLTVYKGYTLTLNDLNIVNCTQTYPVMYNYGTLNINNCNFSKNKYDILRNDGQLTIKNSVFSSNTYRVLDNYKDATLINCTLKSNTCLSNCIYNRLNLYVYNSTFANNSVQPIYSVGIVTEPAYLYVSDSIFEGNSNSSGGAIYTTNNATIYNCIFKNNKATTGGAIYGGNLNITHCAFINNNASKYPVVFSSIKVIFKDNLISYNTNKDDLMGANGVIQESNTKYIYGNDYKIPTTISTSSFTTTAKSKVQINATIKSDYGPIPTGTVKFTIENKTYNVNIDGNGNIRLNYTFNNSGNITIKIEYSGDGIYASTSTTKTVNVKKITTTITANSQTANINQSTTFTANIKASDSSIPTGSVNITVDGTTRTATISSSGAISFSYKFTKSGTYTVKVSYPGNSIYDSSSTSFTVTVALPTTNTVSSYTELYNLIEEIKTYSGSSAYTINLKDGSYKITNTINWGSTKGVKNLVINGNGVNIYGSSQKQFLKISNGYTITINNLGIINGNATNGGSIYNNGNLTLNNCVFNNSKAKDGGAIYTSGVLSVSNCKFNNNQATRYGGSIYTCSGASTTIKSSTFTNGYADVGGAMYNNGYSTTIDSSTFTNNRATTGGSIYNKNYAKISDSTFTTNSAESGGALYNSNSGTKMIVDNTKFNNNTALYGGAIFNYKNANLNVTKTTFSYNQANNGEALRNKNATATLTNNTITFTSDQQSNTIVTTDGKTTTSSIIYNRVNKLNATVNMASSMFVTGNSGTITGNITDSNNKLITDSLTITFSINGKNITTQTIKNGKINVTLSLSSFSSGVYNITTTLKESSNYTSSNATTVLFKDKKHSIVTTSVTGKNGETVTLTAYISNRNGTRATSGTATFKLNGVTIKDSKGNPIKVSIKNGVATYTYTIPTGYSAKDYKLTAVADADGRIENTAKLTIEKTDQKLTASTSMFVTGNTTQLTGTIVDINGKTTTRDTKVAIKINGKTLTNTVVTNGKLDVKLDLSKYNSGAYTIDIVLGENGCYNTGYANMTLIKNMKNSIVVMPTNNTAGSNGTLYAFVTDSNGNRQSSGTVTFKIDGTTIGTGKISNGVANITYNTLQYYTGSHTLTVSTTVNGKTLTNSTTLQIKS